MFTAFSFSLLFFAISCYLYVPGLREVVEILYAAQALLPKVKKYTVVTLKIGSGKE